MKVIGFILTLFSLIFLITSFIVHIESPVTPPVKPDQKKEKTVVVKKMKPNNIFSYNSNKIKKENYYLRIYEFSDKRRTQYKINHAISKKHIKETELIYGYSKKELFEILQKKAKKFEKKYHGKIKITIHEDIGYNIKYKRDHKHLIDQFAKVYDETKKKYLSDHMINLKDNELSPNFSAIQKWQSEYVKSLYKSFQAYGEQADFNQREFIQLLADFVQNINYKIPPDNNKKYIFGLWPPVICLKEKAGDCDSKSILFAALFYHFKKNSCILLLTPGHAFIGIKNQHRIFPTDLTIKIGGIDYLLLETTAARPIGNITKKNFNQIKRGQFRYVAFN